MNNEQSVCFIFLHNNAITGGAANGNYNPESNKPGYISASIPTVGIAHILRTMTEIGTFHNVTLSYKS